MAETPSTRPSPFDVSTTPDDDGSFTLPKLKAASESLRRFNDALLRIGDAEAEASGDRPGRLLRDDASLPKPAI